MEEKQFSVGKFEGRRSGAKDEALWPFKRIKLSIRHRHLLRAKRVTPVRSTWLYRDLTQRFNSIAVRTLSKYFLK